MKTADSVTIRERPSTHPSMRRSSALTTWCLVLVSSSATGCSLESRTLGGRYAPAPLEGEIELDHSTTISKLSGPFRGDAAYPAGVGDVDADGLADYVVADPGGGVGNDLSSLFLHYGGQENISLRQAASDADGTLTFSNRSLFFLDPAALGDVDGDGFGDFAVTATEGWESQPLPTLVFRGAPDLFDGLTTTDADNSIQGPPEGISAMGPLGDLDEDGFADFYAGVVHSDGGLTLFMYYGGPNRLSGGLEVGAADFVLDGVAISDLEVGDFDGDGHLDIATLAGTLGSESSVAILYGTGDRLVGGGLAIVASDVSMLAPQALHLVALDYDGDGASELVVDILGQPSILAGGHRPVELAMSDWVPLLPEHDDPLAPWSVGDLDGDGAEEIAFVGSDRDTVLLAYGGDEVQASAIDATLRVPALDGAGPAVTKIAEAGDVNGDGYDDFLIGDSTRCGGCDSGGATYLVYGAPRE
mgnify:CR=1 FL=1